MAAPDHMLIRLRRVPEERRTFRFGLFFFDAASLTLQRDGRPVPARALSLNLLAYLLVHRDRIVDRRELTREVWGGTVVSEGSLRQAVYDLRQMLDDSAESQHVI